MTLKIDVITANELDPDLSLRWLNLQRATGRFNNPFLSPGYVRLIDKVAEGVRIGVLSKEGIPVGFFPYQLEGSRHATMVGPGFSDCQAVLVQDGVTWNAEDLLAHCGLDTWDFDHLIADIPQFAPFHSQKGFSPLIDLSNGSDAWKATLRDEGRKGVRQLEAKHRQLAAAHGTPRLHLHVADRDLLCYLLRLKGAQWEKSGVMGKFTVPWVERMMHALLDWNEENFSGMLTVLEVSGVPVAMHLGMRSDTVWSYWTTVYDPEYASFSPGLVMLLMMAEAASDVGIVAIDLGMEDFLYKRRLMTASVPMASGRARRVIRVESA